MNVQDCYPKWTIVGSSPGYGWFNKYLVGQVSQQDLVAGSPAHSVTYEYVDEPAWHYDRSTEWHRTWSDWRGYGHVRVWVTGAAPVDTFSFRGMDGDYMDGAPLRSVQLTDSRGDTFVDDGWRRGLTYETQTTVAGTPLGRTFNRWVNLSGVAGSRMTRTDRVDSTLASSGGSLTSRQQYSFDAYGNTVQVESLGDPGSNTDDSCTTISYALNTSAWIVDRVAQSDLHTGTCVGPVVGRSQNLYDNLALGSVTVGNTTSARVATDATTWSSTTLSYDNAGRLTTLDGPMSGAGDAVTTGYDTTYGFARTLTNSLGHQTVTVSDPKRFLPLTVTDANAKTTTNSYDALGRVIAVWTPDDPTNGPAAVTFSYTVTATAPSKVKTSVWQDTTRRLDSWSFYDGLGQQIQTQRPGPNGGSITDFTVYNERGLPARTFSALWSSATPGVSAMTTPTSPVRETVQVWDGAGRPTQMQTWSNGSALSVSSTDYNGYTTTLTPPVGLASSATVNALGRTVQTRRNTPTASATTNYTYNTAGRLLTTTDPAGSVRSNSYDWAGRLLTASDPDGGNTSNTYDPAGRVVTSVNPVGTLWFGYDTLGRPTERRTGTSTGTLRARWAFDAVGEKGLLDYSESFDAAGARIVQTNTTGYDNRNRPTGITYTVDTRPTWTDNGLAGTYPVGFAYDKADHRTVLNYPTAGNLPAETVTTGYNATGQASTLIGAQTYVGNSTFTNEGWVSGRTLRTTTATASRAYGWDAATGRIATLTGTYNGATIQQLSYTYDPGGNVMSTTDASVSERQCFGYDHWNRLTTAYTTGTIGACGGPTGGGPAPYSTTYSYDNRDRIVNGPAGTNYQYTNSAHPHGVTSVNTPDGTDSYTYDASGNRATWVDANGPDFAYSWDVEGRMTKNVSTDAQTPAARSSVTTHNGSGSTTLSLPPPNGTRTGDVLVTSIVVSSPGANKAPPTVTAPAGWTLVATSANANVRAAVFVYPNTVATPWSNTFTFSVAAKAVGGMTSYINVDTSNPIDVSAVGSNTSGTSHVAPSVVTSGVNRLLTSVTGLAVTSSVTPPVTMTERIDAATPTGTKSATIETADQIVFTAGATGTRTSTSPTAATSQTVTYALRPIPIQSEYLYDTDRTVVLRKDAYATFLTLGEFVDLHVVPTGNPWSHRSYKIGNEEVAKNSGGVREWFFNDRQGSVTTTSSDSTIISAARRSHYTPWGKIRPSSAPDPITWYQYIGALDEPNSQLIYLNNRHYDPQTGVFISVDPLVTTTGQPYLYAAGNPTTLSDPSGLSYGCGASGCIDDKNTVKEQQWVMYQNKGPDLKSLISKLQNEGAAQSMIDSVKEGQRYSFDSLYDDLMAVRAIQLACYLCLKTPPLMPPVQDGPRLWNDILTGFDLGADGGGLMACFGIDGSAGPGSASGSSCVMGDTDGVFGLTTVGAGPSVGTPGLAGSVGLTVTNADAKHLVEWSMCGNVSGGAGLGGAGALCGSISYQNDEWSYLGAWTFYEGISVTTPSGSVGYSYTYTWVDSWIAWPWL